MTFRKLSVSTNHASPIGLGLKSNQTIFESLLLSVSPFKLQKALQSVIYTSNEQSPIAPTTDMVNWPFGGKLDVDFQSMQLCHSWFSDTIWVLDSTVLTFPEFYAILGQFPGFRLDLGRPYSQLTSQVSSFDTAFTHTSGVATVLIKAKVMHEIAVSRSTPIAGNLLASHVSAQHQPVAPDTSADSQPRRRHEFIEH